MRFRVVFIILVLFAKLVLAYDKGALGLIVIKEGDVKVTDVDGSQEESVKVGLVIEEGDVIETGHDSHVKIETYDHNIINIKEDSIVVMRRYKLEDKPEVKIHLQKGGVRVNITDKELYKQTAESSFEVDSNTMVAGVRGTDFYMEGDEDASSLTTFEGEVSVSEKNADYSKAISIKAGQSIEHRRLKGFSKLKRISKNKIQRLRTKMSRKDDATKIEPIKRRHKKKPDADAKGH